MAMISANYEYDYEWKNKLPIGFKFVPTEDELYMYLKLKSYGGKIFPGIFSDLDIYQYEPQQLSGFAEKHWDGRMYFFSPLRKKYSNGIRIERIIQSKKGFWKASQARKGKSKNKNEDIIGTRTSLVYYKGRNSSIGKKTSWLMLEYRFPNKLDSPPRFNGTIHELTLCVIYYNGIKKDDDEQIPILDPIPPQTPINQYFDHSQYNLTIPHNSNYNYVNTSDLENPSLYSNIVSNWIPIQQYQPLINNITASSGEILQIYTEIASSSSTMYPSFLQLPYGPTENLDIFPPIPQDFDIHGFDPSISQYLNLDNSYDMGIEEISHIPNADFVDQNKLVIYQAPNSQDDLSLISQGQQLR